MTISEYIHQTFLDFGVRLSNAATMGVIRRNGLDGSANVESVEFRTIDIAIVKSIPILLLTPSAIGEGGLSISKTQRESIEQYYSMRCSELGIANKMKNATVKFL